jgi:hypothetical protein
LVQVLGVTAAAVGRHLAGEARPAELVR